MRFSRLFLKHRLEVQMVSAYFDLYKGASAQIRSAFIISLPEDFWPEIHQTQVPAPRIFHYEINSTTGVEVVQEKSGTGGITNSNTSLSPQFPRQENGAGWSKRRIDDCMFHRNDFRYTIIQ